MDPVLAALLAELAGPETSRSMGSDPSEGMFALPLELDTAEGRLSLISTTTVFGTPAEVTLSELAIEAFYPANEATAERLDRLHHRGLVG